MRDRRDTKFEVLGSKLPRASDSKPRTVVHLTRPAFLASLASLARIHLRPQYVLAEKGTIKKGALPFKLRKLIVILTLEFCSGALL